VAAAKDLIAHAQINIAWLRPRHIERQRGESTLIRIIAGIWVPSGRRGKVVLPNAGEQNAICLMKKLREAGRTLRDIAAELTRQGIATKERQGAWIHSAVAYILARAA
jgi:hypothetical protein